MRDDEIKARQEINRGSAAKAITDNPIYQEAMTAVRGELFNSFVKSEEGESDVRDEIWRMMKTVDFMQKYTENIMKTGALGSATLKLLEQAKRVANIN